MKHTIFSLFNEKPSNKIKKIPLKLFYVGTHRHQDLVYKSQQW